MPNIHPLVDRLLALCPDAAGEWQEHLASWGDDGDRGTYNDLTVFAHHVVGAARSGDFTSADRVFAFIEDSLAAPTEEVEGFLVWGLLEDIQVISSHTPGLERTLMLRLAPRALAQWGRIAQAWAGKASLADVIRSEARKPPDGAA